MSSLPRSVSSLQVNNPMKTNRIEKKAAILKFVLKFIFLVTLRSSNEVLYFTIQ